MQLNKKVVTVKDWGELHIIEPLIDELQPLLDANSDEKSSFSKNFGMNLLKLCLHYPDGRKVFSEPVGISKGKALLPLIADCVEVSGFGGESDANRADDLPVGG